ncbi:hypothetical protein QIS74_00828 [Colletotrichum tabaci]|uniref:Uncharacterized protein n=1 Tax=Colletotrichum tabaci TaxID=1209068 RepID=A0AAV9TUD9_9PEZI
MGVAPVKLARSWTTTTMRGGGGAFGFTVFFNFMLGTYNLMSVSNHHFQHRATFTVVLKTANASPTPTVVE